MAIQTLTLKTYLSITIPLFLLLTYLTYHWELMKALFFTCLAIGAGLLALLTPIFLVALMVRWVVVGNKKV